MFVQFVRSACSCVGILLLLHAGVGRAQAPDGALTLQEALSRSLARNPDLKVQEFELTAQQGRLQQAGARPSPEVGLLIENFLGSGERSSFDAAETTLSLGYLLEHGARQGRIDAAQAGGLLIDAETRVRRLDVAAETARRFIGVLESQQALVESGKATELAEQTARAVETRVRAAKAPAAEEARAQAELARVRLEREHAEHQLASARQRLAALWGATEPDFAEARGDLLSLASLELFEAVRTRLTNNPDIERLLTEKRVREAEVRLAELRRRPLWHVTAGVRRFEDADDHAFVVGLTVPIPSRDQYRGAVSVARALSAQADVRAEALRVQLDAELFAIYQELRHAYAEVDTLRGVVLPRMESASEQSRYAYERGRYSYLEWVAAQRELVGLRKALLVASADVHRRRIEIERLTGASLAGDAPKREIP
jgi:cobalt-zinc-cadmium efflux system outer membrane protein